MLPTIKFIDLGNPTSPGEYPLGGMSILVDKQHLKAWRDAPETEFRTILCTRVGDDAVRLTLGDVAG